MFINLLYQLSFFRTGLLAKLPHEDIIYDNACIHNFSVNFLYVSNYIIVFDNNLRTYARVKKEFSKRSLFSPPEVLIHYWLCFSRLWDTVF